MTRGATTNLCLQSEAVSTSPWSIGGVTVSSYVGALPSGTSNALVLTDTGSSDHRPVQTISCVVGQPYIFSAYVKRVSGPNDWFRFDTPCGRAWWNITTGVTGYYDGNTISTGIVDAGNGWWRVWLFGTANNVTTGFFLYLIPQNAGSSVYVANGSAIALTGAMVEVATWGQTTPSPYVATTSTTADGYREYRQNLQTNSNSFNSNLKNLTAATFVTNAVSAPVLSTLADKLQEDSSNGVHGANINICGPKANLNYTVFFFAKAVGSRQLRVYPNRGDGGAATFNLLTGTSTSSGVGMLGAGIQAMPSQAGWYMCWYSYKESYGTGSNGYNQQVLADATNTISYQGDGSSGVYLFGAQVVDGVCNGPIDYIATIAAQANASGAPRSFGQ